MNEPEARHRLAAILAADAAGYSRVMAEDDRVALAALDAARAGFRTQFQDGVDARLCASASRRDRVIRPLSAPQRRPPRRSTAEELAHIATPGTGF